MSFVRPLSLAARDAIENLPMDFTSARSMAQRQQVLEAFAQLDFIYQGSQRPKLFQLFYDRKDFFVNVEANIEMAGGEPTKLGAADLAAVPL
ncbi:hypothetical protein DFJ58DRAFT_736725 [Suillus subalutaceus]|uniref:uncharacterized protein n=1 Tax=Suillus subalutaceus TaxID=48586 RepID=UPI001B87F2FE|nr:uncharacterized protein DFJ58DRAFT_736725 [Suillus subalutaceus]KAG1831192.1 hypothetical protein DFJ58DRAFT_736725 [Suillus subalutaceus]